MSGICTLTVCTSPLGDLAPTTIRSTFGRCCRRTSAAIRLTAAESAVVSRAQSGRWKTATTDGENAEGKLAVRTACARIDS